MRYTSLTLLIPKISAWTPSLTVSAMSYSVRILCRAQIRATVGACLFLMYALQNFGRDLAVVSRGAHASQRLPVPQFFSSKVMSVKVVPLWHFRYNV